MDIIISNVEQEQLIKQSRLKDLATNDYLKDKNNDNLKEIARLFFADDRDKALALNVGSNIFMTVTDIYSFFISQPAMDIEFDISEISKDLMSVGQAIVGIGVDENKQYKLEYIPATNYLFSNNEHKVIRYYSSIVEDERKYYILKQIYKVGSIENKLYEIGSLQDTMGEKVPLDTIPQTADLKDVYNTGLDRLSIFIATDEDTVYGSNQSLIEKIKQLGYSLDRKAVMFEKQFLQDVDQYKIFNNINLQGYIDNQGKFDTTRVGKVLVNSEGMDGDIKFVGNQNPLIQDAIKYEETQLRKISSATFVPLDFLGLNTSGTTSGSSRLIMISAFIKAIENRQQIIERQILQPILEILEAKKQKVNGEIITTSIFWDDVIPRNSKEIVDELKIARETGLISQYNAIKTYMGYNTDDQVLDELNLLTKENETNIGSESEPNNQNDGE